MSTTPRPPDRTTLPDSLVVDGLSITVGHGANTAVTDVSFTVGRGEAVGLVGESGSGKTLTCRAALGILPPGCDASSGRLVVDGTDVSGFRRKDWQKLRGRHVGAVFQDPGSYLNPSIPVGRQVREAVRATSGRSRRDAAAHVRTLFAAVGLRDPEHVYHQLPAELSGGMLQRVMIAIAICADPRLLVADEATTALDVTVQAEIIELLRHLRDERDVSIVFVSHDLAVIGELCDRIVVFYAGEVVEIGTSEQILHHPRHPYTQAMMRVASVGDYERRELDVIPGAPPLVGAAITGCRFAARCEFAQPACSAGPIALTPTDETLVRCVRADDPEVANHAERVLVKSA
jgi:peptide/nickel transport system ATP-binding protein